MGRKSLVMLVLVVVGMLTPMVTASTQVTLKWGDYSFFLIDEQSAEFTSNFTISFLDGSKNYISMVVVNESTTNLTLPNNTAYIVLHAAAIERYLYLPGLPNGSILAFPANPDATILKTAQVFILNKNDYDILTVKTTDNRIVARYYLPSTSDLFFTGLPGKSYIFQLEKNGAVVYTQEVAMTTSLDYIAIIPPSSGIVSVNISRTSVNLNVTWAPEYRRIRGFVSAPIPISGTVLIRVYAYPNATLLDTKEFNFSNTTTFDFTYFVPANVSLPARAIITMNSTAGTMTRAMFLAGPQRYISERILPNGLAIIMLGGLSLFSVGRKHIDVSGLIAAMVLTLMKVLGVIQLADADMAFIYAMALSLLVFGGGNR